MPELESEPNAENTELIPSHITNKNKIIENFEILI
jgi:hypothetical protein